MNRVKAAGMAAHATMTKPTHHLPGHLMMNKPVQAGPGKPRTIHPPERAQKRQTGKQRFRSIQRRG